MMNSVKLEKVIAKKTKVTFSFSAVGNINKYFLSDHQMFLEYNYNISDIPMSILAIPFVSNVIPLIWMTDSTLIIDELDRSFYECLSNIKSAYQEMFPTIPFKGTVSVKKIINNSYTPELEAASLFSGGVDALTTFIRINDKKPLLITEYGWHEKSIVKSDVWDSDKENAVSFAKEYGLENILIQSNYGTFVVAHNIDRDFGKKLGDSWWHGLHHGLAFISAAIPIAYKLKIECIYIASSNSVDYPNKCASDPTVDNEIRYASGRVFHDGYDLTRQDKVRIITNYYSDKDPVNLRVCFKNKENCCRCEKCLRTIFGIIAEGKNPQEYGFKLPNDIHRHVKEALNKEVKFFTDTFITIYWKPIQDRIRENYNNILDKDRLNWILNYNFELERKKALLRYRSSNLFPIVKRKISNQFTKLFLNMK